MGIETLLLTAIIGGGLMQAQGQRKQYKAQVAAANYNAKIARMEALEEELRRRRESKKHLSQMKVARAKSGVTEQGSPLLVLNESIELAELDALYARKSGENEATRYKQQAKVARDVGRTAVASTILSTATSIGTMKLGK